MKNTNSRNRSFLIAFGAVSVVAAALWAGYRVPGSGSGLDHLNDSTCNAEPCKTHCTTCCTNFNPVVTSPGYVACVGRCAELPANCSSGDTGGGEGTEPGSGGGGGTGNQ